MYLRVKAFFGSWAFPLLLFGGLYLTGLHTPVAAFLQRGILATGLLQPDVKLPEAGRTSTADLAATLDFSMIDPGGRTVNARALAGKVIFLNLWASWCPPCLAELPNIDALYRDYADDDRIAFVLLNVEQDFTKGKDLIRQRGYDVPVYHLTGGMPQALRSGTLPTTYVVAPDGQLRVAHKGMAQYDSRKFRALLDQVVREVNRNQAE